MVWVPLASEFGDVANSKHRDRVYRTGRSPHWVKVKNPNASGDDAS
jgi:hypothetical protein